MMCGKYDKTLGEIMYKATCAGTTGRRHEEKSRVRWHCRCSRAIPIRRKNESVIVINCEQQFCVYFCHDTCACHEP